MRTEKECKKKKFKITKRQVRKAFNGSISILLCLLITPFLTIALSLVEYARYQEVVSLADQLYELTGISILADYDPYIHDRFGLLATSQEQELDANLDTLLETNKSVLSGQGTIANAAVDGVTSLAETEVLRQQVVDFSELTVTTAVLAEDFQLEKLLEKLNSVKQFTDITNTVSGLANVTDKLTIALEKFQALEKAITDLQTIISTAKTNATTFAEKSAELYQKLGDEGIALPENASLQQIETAVTSFSDTYLGDLKELYTAGHNLLNSLTSIKGQLSTIKTTAEEVVTAVNDAKSAMESLNTSNSADSGGKISEEAKTTLDEILDKMVSVVDNTVKELKESTIQTAQRMMDDIINTVLDETGLAGLTTRYYEIVNGDYFTAPLSDTAKEDITDLLKTVYTVYTAQNDGSTDIYTALLDYFKQKFVPTLNFSASELLGKVQSIVQEAESVLVEKANDSLWSMLSDLMNIVKSMFNLDVFYNNEMSAFVDIATDQSGGYNSFLTAVGDLFDAIETFGDKIGSWDVFGALDALGDMFTAIKDLLVAIFEIVGDMFESIQQLGSAMLGGDVRTLYETLLISGYMTHNLPNRTSGGDVDYDKDGNVMMLELTGSGLTGCKYNKIARPALYAGQSATLKATKDDGTKLQELGTFISNLQQGHGSDTMFMGAELEYIRAGTNSEIANQVICFMDLYFLRMLLDLPSIFTDGEVTTIAGAANIAAWVVYILYIVAEPFLDTILLVNGGEVDLVKTDCWLTGTGIGKFIEAFTKLTISNEGLRNQVNGELKKSMESFTSKYGQSGSTGSAVMPLGYNSYMLLLLFVFVTPDRQIERLQDLIELETEQHYTNNGNSFSMYETYTSVAVTADLTINTMIDFGTLTGGSSLIPEVEMKQIVGY